MIDNIYGIANEKKVMVISNKAALKCKTIG